MTTTFRNFDDKYTAMLNKQALKMADSEYLDQS